MAMHEKLCLISAPAGWGKSSLLTAWQAAAPQPERFAFLRLEESDDDVAVFWSYLIAALRTLYPDILPDSEQTLRTPGVDPMRGIVPQLINDLVSAEIHAVLVLDDYHHISQPAIHASLLYLIDHLPPSLRLVVATRSDPPLQLGRLRASGDMLEVRAKRLALSADEATQLLLTRFGLDLDDDSVQMLCDRTEGWPAALQLAGLSLRSEDDHDSFVRRFAGDDRNVADYLTGEVLGHLPADRRDFLLRTSVLDRLTGPLCDSVADVDGSAATLEELERANLFVIPLDSRRSWYRYHNLFADWLQHELRRTHPDWTAELHLRASRWYADAGSLEPTITHAIAATDYGQAAELVDQYVWHHPAQINWSALLRWLNEIPEDVAGGYASLATTHVWFAMARGDHARGLHWCELAEAAVDTAPPDLQPQLRTVASLNRAVAQAAGGQRAAARETFERVAAQERPSGSATHAMAVGLAGEAVFWDEGALAAIPPLREGAAARERLSLSDGGVTALLATAYAEIGDWSAARAAAERALAMPPQREGYRYPDLMAAHYALGRVLASEGQHAEAVVEVNKGLAMARDWIDPLAVAYGCLQLAETVDDFVEKRSLVREARQLTESSVDPGRVPELVTAAERKLSLRSRSDQGTGHGQELTDRERDVLRLLNSELSMREISTELYISFNTARGYAKSIYRKLGVTSRSAAIETARDLDLL